MRKTSTVLFVLMGLVSFGNQAVAQNKMGVISLNEVVTAMPEYKRADTALVRYRDTLQQTFDAFQAEYNDQSKTLNSSDTLKFNTAQLALKRQTLSELLAKLQGFNQEAGYLMDQRKQFLLIPIQRKASEAIRAVSKENGFAFVFEKDGLEVYPDSVDILPLVKKKLHLL